MSIDGVTRLSIHVPATLSIYLVPFRYFERFSFAENGGMMILAAGGTLDWKGRHHMVPCLSFGIVGCWNFSSICYRSKSWSNF
jgi:hypothetical protein